VNLAKYILYQVLQPVGNDGSAQNIQFVAKGVGHLDEVSGLRSLEVLLVFFSHQTVAKRYKLRARRGHGHIRHRHPINAVKFCNGIKGLLHFSCIFEQITPWTTLEPDTGYLQGFLPCHLSATSCGATVPIDLPTIYTTAVPTAIFWVFLSS